MVIYNAATRELTAKIVYYGPGLGGKTTNLQLLHERLEPATVGKLLNLATQTDRTIYFDLLPVELGDIKGYKIRFQLATVPGQTAFNETRRVVLKGTDGIVFVADSQWTMLPKNLESWQNLKENLRANGVSFEGIPIVIQYNKRDLTDILSVDALQEALGLSSYPFVEAVASAGRGVTETFKLISKLTFVDLLRRLQGRKPEDASPIAARREADDLLSWKDSLLNRAAASALGDATIATAGPGAILNPNAANASAKRPLTLVPSLPEEAPFETAEAPEPLAAEADAPFADAAPGRTPPVMSKSPASPVAPAVTAAAPPVAPATASASAPSAPSTPPATVPPAPAIEPRATAAMPEVSDLSELSMPPFPVIPEVGFPTSSAGSIDSIDSIGSTGEMPSVPELPAPGESALAAILPSIAPPAAFAAADEVAPEAEAFPASGADELPLPLASRLSDDTDERIRVLEARLDEALAAIAQDQDERLRAAQHNRTLFERLDGLERDALALGKSIGEKQLSMGDRLEALAVDLRARHEVASRVQEMHERMVTEEKRQRTAEDDVSMALSTFGERGEKLHHQITAIAAQVEILEAALREKTGQSRREADDIRSELETLRVLIDEKIGHSRREAEDIRTQIAPLLEAHGQRGGNDERLSRDFDSLRESIAEALGDLSERLRRAVRGM